MHDIIFFNFSIISSAGSLLASIKIFTVEKYCNYPLTASQGDALQVVRTSFLGPRPRLPPPPRLFLLIRKKGVRYSIIWKKNIE